VRLTRPHISIRLCVSWAYQWAYQNLGILCCTSRSSWLRFMLFERTEPGPKMLVAVRSMERESRWWTWTFHSAGSITPLSQNQLRIFSTRSWALVATRRQGLGYRERGMQAFE